MVFSYGINLGFSGSEATNQGIELNQVGNPNLVGLQLMKVYFAQEIHSRGLSLSLKWLIFWWTYGSMKDYMIEMSGFWENYYQLLKNFTYQDCFHLHLIKENSVNSYAK